MVADLLHVTRAADRLFISPSAVSKHMRQLELHSGGKLFRVVGKQLHLTDLAIQLLPQARKVLDQAALFEAQLCLPAQNTRPINLHIGNTYQRMVFDCLDKFRQRHHDIDFEIEVTNWTEQQDCFDMRLQSIFIAGEPNVSSQVFHQEQLLKSSAVLVVGRHHPLAQCRHLSLQHLSSYSWVISFSKSRSQVRLREWFSKQGFEKTLLQLPSFESVQFAVESGLGMAYLPEMLLRKSLKSGKLVRLEVGGLPDIFGEVVMLYRKDLQISESMLLWMRFLRRYFLFY